MKKVMILVLLVILLPVVVAQEEYSGVERFTDDVKLFFSGDKADMALEIREKEVNSALENMNNGNTEDAVENLENAQEKLLIVQEEINVENAEEIGNNVDEVKNNIDEAGFTDEFEEYLLEEEKTQLSAELTLKTFEYCQMLAESNYDAMLNDEDCNPEIVEGVRQLQEESFDRLMYNIRSCIDDPGTCECEQNTEIVQKAKCEKMVALAIKCEYKDDVDACSELESMEPVEGDGFAESFVPNFLMNMFTERKSMIDYDIEKSDVPEECYNENERVKTQCAAFRELKELGEECFDSEGNFLVEECGGPKEDTPTMQESIPQCFDSEGNFLTECGEVTIIWNEEGLINYIFEASLNEMIDQFENLSEQNTIDFNGPEGQTMVNQVKEEITSMKEDIVERTFAEGTYDTGEPGLDIKNVVVETGESNGDDGLTPEVVTDISGSEGGGDNGLVTEVVTGGGSSDEPLPEPDLDAINPDLSNSEGPAPGDTIDDTYDDDTITNEIAP